MKKLFLTVSIFLCFPCFLLYALTNEEAESHDVERFIADFKKSIENRDLDSYKEAFSKNLKNAEAEKFHSFFDDSSMESVSVESVSVDKKDSYQSRIYLTLSFENLYSLILDTWLIDVVKADKEWKIFNKDNIGQTQILYKLQIPSERMERVKKVEIRHKDILFSFENPVVFYDNVPDIETALIVIGKGRVHFTPSLPREQHHLELIYNQKSIKDHIDYIYLRFSPDFFKDNIKIIKGISEKKAVEESEKELAQSLFKKKYPKSFTVKSSLTQDYFSVLPNGEEATFEFKINKLGEMTYIFSPFALEEICLYHWKKEKIISLYSPPMQEKGKRMFVGFGEKVDIKDYQIDMNYEPKSHHFSGKAKVIFESNVANLNSVKFRLNPKLKILRVSDKKQNKLYFSQDDFRKTVYIYFFDRLSRGELGDIDIYYSGQLAPLKEDTEVVRSTQEQTEIEFLEKRDESYLYSRSSYWYPAPAEEDYFTARLKLMIPSGYTAVSNGRRIYDPSIKTEQDVHGADEEGYTVNIFEIKNQIKYLAFIVGRMSLEGEVNEPILTNYYRAPKSRAYHGDIFKTIGEIIDFYQDKFGSYPFDKLSIVRQAGKSKWGHSTPAFVVISDLPPMSHVSFRRRIRSPVDLSSWNEYFLAHEIAHQWWGHGVSWKSYHDQWISEGLAQYSASLFLRNKYGEEDFSEILKQFSKWTEKNTEWGAITMGSRISHLDFEAFQSIIYNKSALVLNMLRNLLGDEMFFKGMQRFFMRNKYIAADTHKFMSVFNELANDDLNSFFNGWFHSYHLPEVKVSYSIDKNETGFILRLSVIQDESFFMFPLWLEWKENGNRVRKKVTVDKKVVNFDFKLKYKPKKIKINPDKAVPGRFSINKS
ncbi:MAG: M1 family metallopeptidase [Acidobacteriota bacterium]